MLSRCLQQLIPLSCYVAFSYQFVSVTRDYLRYRTTTKVEHYVEDPTNLPAVTFNFETPIPMKELFFKAFPNRSYPYDDNTLDPNLYRDGATEPSWYNSTLGAHCSEMFDSDPENEWMADTKYWVTELYACVYHYFPNRTVRAYLQELKSLFGWRPLRSDKSRRKRYFGCGVADDSVVRSDGRDQRPDLCHPKLMRFGIGWRGAIGITLFAHAPQNVRFRSDSRITISFIKSEIQPFLEWSSFLQVHAPDEPPHSNQFRFLAEADHDVTYHRVATRRLPPPYDTFCHDYKRVPVGTRWPLDGAKSQKDCLARCIFGIQTNATGNSFNHFFVHKESFFFESDLFWPEAKMSDIWRERTASNMAFLQSELPCQRLCPDACDYIWYDWSPFLYKNTRDMSCNSLFLSHRFDNDMHYSHLPAIDLFEYLACVGGLAGMWIGVSFYSLWMMISRLSFFRLKREIASLRELTNAS